MFHLVLDKAGRDMDRQVTGNYHAWHETVVAREGFLHKLVLKEGEGEPGRGAWQRGERGGVAHVKAC